MPENIEIRLFIEDLSDIMSSNLDEEVGDRINREYAADDKNIGGITGLCRYGKCL
jgi:hypothetical protein